MTSVHDEGKLNRLEDFINLAKKGGKVGLVIDLRKQFFRQKVHPEETDDMSVETDMYFLIGDFLLQAGPNMATVSKIYVYGSLAETVTENQVNASIANERLKMEYQRLKDAGVKFEEKYF